MLHFIGKTVAYQPTSFCFVFTTFRYFRCAPCPVLIRLSLRDRQEHKPTTATFTTAWQQMETEDSRRESPSGVLPYSIITGVQWEENHESSVSGSNQSLVHYNWVDLFFFPPPSPSPSGIFLECLILQEQTTCYLDSRFEAAGLLD